MKKEYILQGLTCANCAAKIETDILKLEGVTFANASAISSTLILNVRDGYADNIITIIENIVHRHEPDVVVIDKSSVGAQEKLEETGDKPRLARLATGGLIFVLGFALGFMDERFSIAAHILAYAVLGYDVIWRALRNIAKGQIFEENFLMSVATIGALVIGEYPEAAAVMLFYQIGEYFQEAAVRNTKRSITGLMDMRPDYANLRDGDVIIKVTPESVNVGDIIIVKPGEKVPLDGIIVEGESDLDMRSLTGESLPRSVKAGDNALVGCVNQGGTLAVEVSKPFGESTAAKIIQLVENVGGQKAHAESFITRFSRYYTPVVVLLAALVAVMPPLLIGGAWAEWINRGLVFLVISCPCALVISVPLSFFSGIGRASRHGILIKGGNYLDALNNLDIIIFDKTGTLTKGVFEVTRVNAMGGYTEAEVLELAARAEAFSKHPISRSILSAYGKTPEKAEYYQEYAGRGVSAEVDGKTILAGNLRLMDAHGINAEGGDDTTVHVAFGGSYAGNICIADTLKPDSAAAIRALKNKGVRKTVMLTGDNERVARAIADELSIDETHAELMPHEKVEYLERLDSEKRVGGRLAFVGDGINDAPVLARADIGIAMGGLGSDAAIEAADIVLMTDEPSKLADAVDIAKMTRRVVLQNIIFALAVKTVVLLMGALGFATMWEAVFADVGVSLLAVLNAVRILRTRRFD